MITNAKVANQSLIGEISPAMMQKLRRDWRQSSTAFALLFLLGGIHLLRQTESFAGLNETWFTIFGVLNFVFSAAFFCAAYFGQTLAVQEELSYRRQQGKWRWEN